MRVSPESRVPPLQSKESRCRWRIETIEDRSPRSNPVIRWNRTSPCTAALRWESCSTSTAARYGGEDPPVEYRKTRAEQTGEKKRHPHKPCYRDPAAYNSRVS